MAHDEDQDHPKSRELKCEVSVLRRQQQPCGAAEPLLLDAFGGRETKLSPDHPRAVDSLKQLVTLYEPWPKPDEAAKWQAKLPQNEPMEQ